MNNMNTKVVIYNLKASRVELSKQFLTTEVSKAMAALDQQLAKYNISVVWEQGKIQFKSI